MRYKVAYYIAMQLKPVRNTELHNYIIHQPVTVIAQACMHMQPDTCKNEAFSSTSTTFNPYFGWYKTYIAK